MSPSTTNSTTGDSDLVALTLQGRTEAFGELVRRYQDPLYNTVVRIVGCPADAEDVLQDAFVLALVKLRSFKGQSTFFTWLYRLTMNCALSHRRRKRPLPNSDLPRQCNGQYILEEGEQPMDRLLREETRKTIASAFDRMNGLHRAILVLREIDRLDYATIADILGIHVGTVRSRLHRARLRIRELLAGAV